jgi:predicted transport protein
VISVSLDQDSQTKTMINNMPDKTGKSLDEWFKVLAAAGLEKHGDIMKLLKGEYGVTHGFANTIATLYRQQAAGGPPAEADLVADQYAGAKAGLKPIYEAVVTAVNGFGQDVEIAPKKSYVSLRRKKQFAIIQPATKARVDLGLNLDGIDSAGRLQGGGAFSGMCSHKVAITSPDEIDAEVIAWLKQAYEQAG